MGPGLMELFLVFWCFLPKTPTCVRMSFQGESNQGVPDLGKKKNQLELGQPGEVESRASLDRHCGPGWLGWKELGSAGVTEELPMSSAASDLCSKVCNGLLGG